MADPAPSASTYQAVVRALENGKPVRLVTDLSQCATPGGQSGPAIQAGVEISAFIVVAGKGLFFSDVHPTLDATDHRVTEYVRYNLATDGNLTMVMASRVGDTVKKRDPLVCKVPTAAKFVW